VLPDGQHPYRIRVASSRSSVQTEHFALRVPWRLDILEEADTVVVPGLDDPFKPTPASVLRSLRDAYSRGARIASICVGAFLLAEAGLLDGVRATTHWAATGELARRYPTIQVDPNVLFVDSGSVLTSAGAAAGLDLCLHLVRRDFGSNVAADTARGTVMSLERSGGQAQFINRLPATPESGGLAPLLSWIEEHCHEDLALTDIAANASLSVRTLNRRFQDLLGVSPMRWLRIVRIRRAQQLLETTTKPVEMIATLVGFGSSSTFRTHFVDVVGTNPASYRRNFVGSTPTSGRSSLSHR
jgi:transcriptional regulator GlxA family with amidase domain